jgi:hypothetical protein
VSGVPAFVCRGALLISSACANRVCPGSPRLCFLKVHSPISEEPL